MAEEGQTQTDRLLGALMYRAQVRDVWYNQKTVTLDGYDFHHCRFDGCKLSISSTNFALDRCFIDESTVVYYGDEVMRVMKLFNSRFKWAYDAMPAFVPQRHEDGTVSIT